MDGFVLTLFLAAAFAGGFASGLAGFAMGFIVSGIWLHILTPVQTTALIAGYGLLTQGYGVWKLRHPLAWKNIAPFIIGGIFGVPIGTALLTYSDPAYLRGGAGLLLVIYGVYGLMQPTLKPVPSNIAIRVRQWSPRWSDRAAGLHHHHLVSAAGLEERLSTRRISASSTRCHRSKRHIIRCSARYHPRYSTTLLDRVAGHGSGPLVWVQTLWKTQRGGVPESHPIATCDRRIGFDLASHSLKQFAVMPAISLRGLLYYFY